MNVHKLLENTLFECVPLGHAPTFGHAGSTDGGAKPRRVLPKASTEAARSVDGWTEADDAGRMEAASKTLDAAASKDGWGWAVNYGDIWISASAARLIQGAALCAGGRSRKPFG